MKSFIEAEAEVAQKSQDLSRMQRVASALRAYYMAFGVYPSSLDDLVNASPALVTQTTCGAPAETLSSTTSPPIRWFCRLSDPPASLPEYRSRDSARRGYPSGVAFGRICEPLNGRPGAR